VISLCLDLTAHSPENEWEKAERKSISDCDKLLFLFAQAINNARKTPHRGKSNRNSGKFKFFFLFSSLFDLIKH
jgi:hypothetical protein